MPNFTPGKSYKWSQKTRKYRVSGGRRTKGRATVSRTAENRKRVKSHVTRMREMGMTPRYRLRKTPQQAAAARRRAGGAWRRAA